MMESSSSSSSSSSSITRKLETRLAQAGCGHHSGGPNSVNTYDVTPPIHLSTTYERLDNLSYPAGFVYSRHANPTRSLLEATMADLDNGEESAAFSSGMAAANAVLQAYPKSYIVYSDDLYHGIRTLLQTIFNQWGAKSLPVNMTDLNQVESALRTAFEDKNSERVLVWMESPSNPMLNVTDVKVVMVMATSMAYQTYHKNVLTLVDTTWSTPYLIRPLDLRIDFVLHSCTKYLGGHSDLLGGVVTSKKTKKGVHDEEVALMAPIRHVQQTAGAVMSPLEAWLVLRGLRSLAPRIRLHCENAVKLAHFLTQHPVIEVCHYPGLPTHPGHEVATKLMQKNRFGGMMSIQIKGGREAAVLFQSKVQVFRRATSLGGTESLLEHRRSVEGNLSTTPDNLIRISVGLEAYEDLEADMAQALDAVVAMKNQRADS